MSEPVKSRDYDGTSRQARSEETRARILDEARRHVLEHGYRATTVAAIAEAAGVHVDTVYRLVGRKPVILRELIELAISGEGRAVDAEDRSYVKAMRAETDAARKLALYAAAMRRIQERMAPLFLALQDASTTEPEAREVWQEIGERRAANMRKLARDLRDTGRLRADLTVRDAADVIWATNSAELYVLLTGHRGWTPDKYERWLADSWCRLLLDPAPSA